MASLILTSYWLQVEEVLCRLDPGLTAARGKLLYEVTRFRMMTTLQQLQSRWEVVLSAQYSAVVSNALHRSPDPAKVCAQLEAAVCDLEDAVAGISGARCGDRRAGLRQRMAALAGLTILGEGYRMLLNTCLKMPFVK